MLSLSPAICAKRLVLEPPTILPTPSFSNGAVSLLLYVRDTQKFWQSLVHSTLGRLIESCGRDSEALPPTAVRVFVEELLSLLATPKASNLPNLLMQLAMEPTSRSTFFWTSSILYFIVTTYLRRQINPDGWSLFSASPH
jgi:hypothetical protein